MQITEPQTSSDQREQRAAIEVDVDGRWDALALSELLIPFRSFLVQQDRERWVVHAYAPGGHGEPLADALEAIDDWRADRQPVPANCRVNGRPTTAMRDRAPDEERWPRPPTKGASDENDQLERTVSS
jgi:hypothetical protein